jgi:hypothetical protein
MVWAVAPFAELGGKMFNGPQMLVSSARDVAGAAAVSLGGLGAYWVLFGAIVAAGERQLRFLLHPFAQGLRRRHGWYLSIVGAAVLLVSAATLFFIRG